MRVSRVFAFAGTTAFVLVIAGCDQPLSSTVSAAASGSPGTGGSKGSGGAGGAGGAADAVADAGLDAATGCGLAGAPTGVLPSQTITVGSDARTYLLSVPRSYDPNTPLALVFGWHAHGATGALARQQFSIEPAAAGGAIFVYPDGLGSPGSTTWDSTANSRDVGFFDTLLGYLASTYCIDRNRVFSTGLSAGANFTNAVGCYRGDVLRAIAPVAGRPPSTTTCVGNVGAWVAHASNDITIDFTTGGIATRDFWIARNGCSTTLDPVAANPAQCVEYQGCQPDLPVVWCVHTEGHSWPSLANCLDGGVCFDAGPAIWGFFASFR